MSDNELANLGPVDYFVIEFPEGHQSFTGEIAQELVRLSDAGTIRVIDVLVLAKDDDGGVEVVELSDAAGLDEVVQLEVELAAVLAAEDIENLAYGMSPGSVGGVLVFENLWAAPVASAARRAGGQLVANGRIPIQAIIASIDSE
jgi:fructosamine-3-kinase